MVCVGLEAPAATFLVMSSGQVEIGNWALGGVGRPGLQMGSGSCLH